MLVVAVALLADPLHGETVEDDRSGEPARTVERRQANEAQNNAATEPDAQERATLGGSLTAVAQQVNGSGSSNGQRQFRGNYRADVAFALPAGQADDLHGTFFAHLRAGQGQGVTLRPTFTSTPNTTAFQTAASPDDAYAIVAQAWYQVVMPLEGGPTHTSRIEMTAGKLDPFVFFDQNAIADDETMRFLNNAFVHNPLLDAGGDAGVDDYGFTPGVRFAYVREVPQGGKWAVSIAVLGSGPHAHFDGSLPDRFLIAQVETTQPMPGGTGTFRLYAWRNGRADNFAGVSERHAGVGISADQPLTDALTLFERIGAESYGNVRFDRAVTVGAEIGGSGWRRPNDAFAFAAGWLRTSRAYREFTTHAPVAACAASGVEQIIEAYYRWRVADHVEVTPDVQWLGRAAGERTAPDVWVGGIRARIGF